MAAAVLLINPKYPHNLAQVVRACAAYGVDTVRYTGDRLDREIAGLDRLPREERMKGYRSVSWSRTDAVFLDRDFEGLVPVCVEVRMDSVPLPVFQHPKNALYVFGPEDGGLTRASVRHCHHFVAIPTRHCLNLSMAVGTVLYDRQAKAEPGRMLDMALTENRGAA